MTIHRSHHPEAAPARYRNPDPSPERLLSAADEASTVGDRTGFAVLGFGGSPRTRAAEGGGGIGSGGRPMRNTRGFDPSGRARRKVRGLRKESLLLLLLLALALLLLPLGISRLFRRQAMKPEDSLDLDRTRLGGSCCLPVSVVWDPDLSVFLYSLSTADLS